MSAINIAAGWPANSTLVLNLALVFLTGTAIGLTIAYLAVRRWRMAALSLLLAAVTLVHIGLRLGLFAG